MESESMLVELLVQFTSGGIAGALANSISYPFTNLTLRRMSENLTDLDLKTNKGLGKREYTREQEMNAINSNKNNEENLILVNNNKSTILNINNTLNLDNINSTEKSIHINVLTGNTTNSNNFLESKIDSDNNQKMNVFKELLLKIYENLDIFKYCFDIIKNEGLSALFDGLSSSVLGGVIHNGVYFCAVKVFDYLFKHFDLKINGIFRSIIINLLTSICTAFVTNPIGVLNIRMAKRSKEDRNIGNYGMMKKIIAQEGFGGFYKGLIPSLFLTFNPVILFTTYEALRKSFSDTKGNISNKNILLISLLSRIISILINYPLMTIKSLYQANSHLKSEEVWKLLIKMIKDESFIGLYKGLSSKLIAAMINNVVLMVTYEKIQKLSKIIFLKMILGIKT